MQRLSNQTEETTRSVQQFKISGVLSALAQKKPPFSITTAQTRTNVGQHDLDIEFELTTVPSKSQFRWIQIRIALATDLSVAEVSFTGRVLDQPMSRCMFLDSEYVKDDALIVECEITVQRPTTIMDGNVSASAAKPSSDLLEHLGELLWSQKGADITFLVSGEAITAHKCVLAARSPVFMAELFGDMKEKAAQQIEIEDMEADVFRALIKFIYTDTLQELVDGKQEEMLAHHLLVAADRYGMDRLKLICKDKICAYIGVGTAAAALFLAEQHGCSKLKGRCMEFIVANPTHVEAIMETDGYKHLMEHCPSLASELLRGCR